MAEAGNHFHSRCGVADEISAADAFGKVAPNQKAGERATAQTVAGIQPKTGHEATHARPERRRGRDELDVARLAGEDWRCNSPSALKPWNRRVNRDRVKIQWRFDRKAARRKSGYKRNRFTRSKT